MTDRRFTLLLGTAASAFILGATALALLLLSGCAAPPLLPVGACDQDRLLPGASQRIQWHNADYACRCGLASCPDYGLPS